MAKTLYIVLTRTNTVISKLIQIFKKDEYTHAAVSFDKELDYMYSFGRKYYFFPFYGRFKKESVHEGFYKYCKTLPGLIFEVKLSEQQCEKAKMVLTQFISNSEQYKYNYKGLIYSLFNKPVCNNNRFLCSEFVYYILKESGVADLKISRNLVRPQSLLKIDGNVIYKGDLKKIKLLKSHWYSYTAKKCC